MYTALMTTKPGDVKLELPDFRLFRTVTGGTALIPQIKTSLSIVHTVMVVCI